MLRHETCDPRIAAGLRLHGVDVTTTLEAGFLHARDAMSAIMWKKPAAASVEWISKPALRCRTRSRLFKALTWLGVNGKPDSDGRNEPKTRADVPWSIKAYHETG